MALGALSLIATMFGLAKLPSDFTNGLRQLFRSDKDGWLELCNINFLDSVTLQAWNPVTTVAVVLDFRQTLINLLDTGIPTLVIYLSPGQPINKRAPGQIGDSFDEQPVSIEKLKVTKPPDDVSPNFLLFEMQRLRGTRDDVTDGYRLPLHRPRLNPCELKVVLAKLRNHLINSAADEAGWKKKAHAVARIVALLCGLSLKRCFGLPLVRKGSMRLDIEQGVLRRDILVIAPRKDTPNSQRFCGRWWRTRLPQEVHVVLRQLLSRTSHAKTLGDLLKAEGLDHTMCQDFLREDWHSSHFPEDSRFALSFRPCLLSLGIHPALVARLTGDTMTTPPSDIYYLSFTEVQVHEAMSAFCVWAGLTPPNAPVRNRSIGTPKALSLDQFQQLIEQLNQKVSIARNAVGPKSPIADVIVFHNIYTKSVALQLIWGVGARGDRIPSLTFERMFASEDFIAIADRRVDRYSRQRIIPCPRVLTETRKRYLEHLCAVSARLESADNENSRLFVQAASGKRPHDSAFLIFDETRDGWVTRGLTRKDLVALANELGASDLNTGRHFWFTELMTRNISEVAIEALLGHHINKAEAFGFSSGVSVREVSDYVCPIVEDVQHLLGFRSLVGCGRKAERFLKLAELVARRSLRPLPSRLLRRKLDAQDFLIDEVAMYQQDPPSTCKTLTAHAQLTRMKKNYVKSSAIGSYPEGALLFCLIAMDLVLANIEQRALFAAALGEGLTATGKLAVVEASDGNRPIVQRLVSVHTLVAAETVRRSNANHPKTYTIAQTQLHQLLLLLSPGWAGRNSEDSATLLSTLASHWAAIEIPPGTLFGVFHKAPFLPVADLARLHFKRACRISAGYDLPVPPLQRKFKNYFEPSLNIVKYWGDKDHPLGEDRARRKGCTEALREHAQQERLDEIGALFVDLLCADLSKEAPFRTLSLSVLAEYSRGYAHYFSFAQAEGSLQLEPDEWMVVYKQMGGSDDLTASHHARWQMMHISAFLVGQGYWVPAGFLTEKGKKSPALPRLPVYTSAAEIAAARQDMETFFNARGGTFSFAGERLELQRSVPLRVSEVRYARTQDFDGIASLFHVTSTGHDHLKSKHSRGSAPVNKSLSKALAKVCERRHQLNVGKDTLLFADAHLDLPFSAFDAVSDAITRSLIYATGCPRFRQHDLRAAAVTDAVFDVSKELDRVCLGKPLTVEKSSGADITEKHRRFAWGSRLARHGSVLTTMRYYNCAGMLDLHLQLEVAHQALGVGGAYVAALSGKKPQALYAASHRQRARAAPQPASMGDPIDAIFASLVEETLSKLACPDLSDSLDRPSISDFSAVPRSNAAKLIQAMLLAALGMAAQACSDAVQLPISLVTLAVEKFDRRSSELGIKTKHNDRTSLLSSTWCPEINTVSMMSRLYSTWLSCNTATLQHAALPLATSVDSSGSRLVISNYRQLLDLIPLLSGIASAGFQVVFRPGANQLLSQYAEVDTALLASPISVHPSNSRHTSFGTLSFLINAESALSKKTALVDQTSSTDSAVRMPVRVEKASPRSYGRGGRLALAGLIAGLCV